MRTFREELTELYRCAYAQGYANGRLAEMTGKPYDAAVPEEQEADDNDERTTRLIR